MMPKKISSLILPSATPSLSDRPKILVINSHGSCPTDADMIQELPVDVVTTSKLGCPHHRALFKPGTDELTPHLTLSFKEMLKSHRGHAQLSEQAIKTIEEMSARHITESHPELHPVDSSLEDIELFCHGAAMAEGVYAIYSDDTMVDVSSHFGLTTIKHDERVGFVNPNSKFPTPVPERIIKALRNVHDTLQALKSTMFSKSEPEKRRLNLEIEHYNSTIDMVSSITQTSRLQPSNYLLSNLLNTGIRNGIINPKTDCVVVFACRKIKERGGKRKRYRSTGGKRKHKKTQRLKISSRKLKKSNKSNKSNNK